jgi:hypothetical protein
MKLLHAIRCRFAWHRWGPIVGDVGRAHQQCIHCGRVKRIDTGPRPKDHPPEGFGKWA